MGKLSVSENQIVEILRAVDGKKQLSQGQLWVRADAEHGISRDDFVAALVSLSNSEIVHIDSYGDFILLLEEA